MEGRCISCYGLVSLLTLFFFFFISDMATCSEVIHYPHQKTNTDFIKASCGVTLYPEVCFKSLSVYASTIQTNPRQLVDAALSVSLTGARSTSSMALSLSKGHDMTVREAAAVMDCTENMGDSVDELQQSMGEMTHLGGPDFDLQMGNIQTWVSAALTNENTCMDGFEGMNGNIKNTIRSSILSVAQLTSNALALVNSLSSTQANSP